MMVSKVGSTDHQDPPEGLKGLWHQSSTLGIYFVSQVSEGDSDWSSLIRLLMVINQ